MYNYCTGVMNMKWIRKHKFTTFVLFMYVVLVVMAFFVNKLFFSANGSPVYGDRLEGIEDVAVLDDQYQNMKKDMEDGSSISTITHSLSGKTVNIIITVGDFVALEQAKQFGNKTLEYFQAEQLAFYDIQVFIKKENKELNDFPIIGYKHYTKAGFSWTKDRQVSE